MFALSETLQHRFAALRSRADFWSLRHVQESRESYWVRRRVAQAPSFVVDAGAMLSVRIAGVEAYAATSDTSQAGLQAALERAEQMARALAGHNLLNLGDLPQPAERADDVMPGYQQPQANAAQWFELLMAESVEQARMMRSPDLPETLAAAAEGRTPVFRDVGAAA